MITKEKEHQIELYLNSKKLTAQILAEVKDHFISQISHLMLSENLSFPEAFLKAKISWNNGKRRFSFVQKSSQNRKSYFTAEV